jgi:hypothetical protein
MLQLRIPVSPLLIRTVMGTSCPVNFLRDIQSKFGGWHIQTFFYRIVLPPSMNKVSPVIKSDDSATNKRTIWGISIGLPNLPKGLSLGFLIEFWSGKFCLLLKDSSRGNDIDIKEEVRITQTGLNRSTILPAKGPVMP